MVSRSHEHRYLYDKNNVKLRGNKARIQTISRAKPDRGSIRMNADIGPA